MIRTTLLHNSKAGRNQPSSEELIGSLASSGYSVEYQSTKDKGISWKNLKAKTDLFVVAGGDGTVGKIARKLVGCHVPIGILPIGTANNIATSLGVKDDFRNVIKKWDIGKRTKFGVGEASGRWGKDYFIESVGFGLFTCLMDEVYPEHIKREKAGPEEEIRTAVTHLIDIAKNFKPQHYNIFVDGKDISGSFIMLEIMNIKCIGPNLMLSPVANHNDDELEVVVVGENEREELIAYFESILSKNPRKLNVPYYKGKSIKVISPPGEAHVDDELRRETKGEIIDICLSNEYLEFLS